MTILRKFLNWIYLVYAVVISIAFVLLIGLCMLPSLFLCSKDRYRFAYFVFHIAFQGILLFIGIRIQKQYQNNSITTRTKCIYVSNHLSYLDAFITTATIKNVFRPLGKAGITSIPFIGFFYKQYVILVDRKSIQSKKHSLKEMKHTLDNGDSVLLFPEGTFYTEITQTLNEFKDGAFHLAIENQVPIQPVLLCYTRERLSPKSPFSLNPGKVLVCFLDAVSTSGYDVLQAKELKTKVYELMRTSLESKNYPIRNIVS